MNIKALVASALALPALAIAAGSVRQDFNKVIASQPDPQHGEQLFAHCSTCHGADGGGVVAGSTPRIAGQHYRVLVRQIVEFRHGTRWDFRMEGVAASHDVLPQLQDIADVAFHVSRMNRDSARGVGEGLYLERGAALYAAHCASCHGERAEGDNDKDIPRIAGQHAAYLARQIYDAVDGRRPQLSKTHARRFAPFKFEEVLGLTDYLSRQEWQREPAAAPEPAGVPSP